MADTSTYPIKAPFGSRRYRLRKFFKKYFSLANIADLVSLIVTFSLGAVLAFERQPWVAGVLVLVYVIAQFTRGLIGLKRIKDQEEHRVEVIRQFFHHMNETIFGGSNQHRFTLFTVDPINKNYIIPYVRHRIGGGNDDAKNSKAYYPTGVGYTGLAWETPNTSFYKEFPEFNNRDEFEEYYRYRLQIPADIVSNISDHMLHVRHIFCWGFTDRTGRGLGVLSLDSREPWDQKPEEMSELSAKLASLKIFLEASSFNK